MVQNWRRYKVLKIFHKSAAVAGNRRLAEEEMSIFRQSWRNMLTTLGNAVKFC